ncbi:MAG: hypothetical protein NVSMB16_16690 [Acidimicrobiales bacterium]
MSRMRHGRVLLMGGAAGVVLAHALAYLIAIPDSHERAAELVVSGHGYWPVAVAFAVAASLVAVAGSALHGYVAGADGSRLAGSRSTARLGLAAWQVGLFVTMEVSERLCSGVDPSGLTAQPEFVAGLLLQVVVAFALEGLLHGVAAVVEHLVVNARRLCGQAGPLRRWPLVKPRSIAGWIGRTSPSRGPPGFAFR